MYGTLEIKRYRNLDGGFAGAVQLTEDNFQTVQDWLGGEIWHSGTAYAFAVGLTFGEYEDKTYVPFGWWIVQCGGTTTYLADVAFTNEYTEV
jgi:hypothetical protein